MTEPLDLDELERITSEATPGERHWAGNIDTGEPYLATWIPGAGRCQILGIGHEDRATTGRAADEVRSNASEFDLGDPEQLVHDWAHDSFGQPVRDPRLQFMTDLMCVNARDLAKFEVAPSATSREDPKVYRADIVGIRHPDAVFLATFSPATVNALLSELREAHATIERVRSGAKTLGEIIKQQCDDIVKITGSEDLICDDGDGDWEGVWGRGFELRAERDAALATIERVRELHREGKPRVGLTWCECCEKCYPCPTIQALDAG